MKLSLLPLLFHLNTPNLPTPHESVLADVELGNGRVETVAVTGCRKKYRKQLRETLQYLHDNSFNLPPGDFNRPDFLTEFHEATMQTPIWCFPDENLSQDIPFAQVFDSNQDHEWDSVFFTSAHFMTPEDPCTSVFFVAHELAHIVLQNWREAPSQETHQKIYHWGSEVGEYCGASK